MPQHIDPKNIIVPKPIGTILAVQNQYDKLGFHRVFGQYKKKGRDLNSLMAAQTKERFKSNAFLNGAVRLHSIQKYHIQIGEELFGRKNLCLNFVRGLDIATAIHRWARSSDRQSTWLLRCMEKTHALEDTRWSGVQIPPSPFFRYLGG